MNQKIINKLIMRISRFAVIIYPFLVWLLAQAYFFNPELFYISLIISTALTIVLAFILKKPEREVAWWTLAILPLTFLIAISVFISLQSSGLLVQALFAALFIFLFSYFKNLYYFWSRPDLYREEDFNVIKSYGGFLVVFFAAASLYGLQSFLNLTIWPMMMIFAAVVLALSYLNLDVADANPKTVWQFSVIMTLVITEVALVFTLLPLTYSVSAMSVGILYYLLINLTRLYLQKSLTSKKIKLYLLISSAGLAIMLLTARWIN